jgi:hypothetical protein
VDCFLGFFFFFGSGKRFIPLNDFRVNFDPILILNLDLKSFLIIIVILYGFCIL